MVDRAQLRRFIAEYFSDDELEDFCFDYFPEVLRNFADGMTKGDKVRLLITFAEHRKMTEHLHMALAKTRPETYPEWFSPVSVPDNLAPFKTRNPNQVFICHAHEDAELAYRIASDLREAGVTVWLAPDSIQPGEKWVSAINRGLSESGVFLLLLTPEAVKSRWVREETDAAIGMEDSTEVQLLVAKVKPVEAPPLWAARQHISFED
jgi:hypothetical protein